MVRQTADCSDTGFDDELAEGSFRLTALLDDSAEQYLYGCKGLEFPAYSAQGLKRMGIGYAIATRGGSRHDTRPTLQYAGEHNETTEGTPEFAAQYTVKNGAFLPGMPSPRSTGRSTLSTLTDSELQH